MFATILSWLGNLIGGPFAKAAVDAYKAKLAAGNDHDRIAADLAARAAEIDVREAAVNAQVLIAEQGNWLTRSIRPLLAMPVVVLLFKVIVYDKALGQWTHGHTDALDPNLWGVVTTVVIAYMGGRSAEKIADRIAGILRK